MVADTCTLCLLEFFYGSFAFVSSSSLSLVATKSQFVVYTLQYNTYIQHAVHTVRKLCI